MMRLPSLLEHFELAEKTARHAKTPISKVKSLLMVDPDENVLIRRMMIRKIPRFLKNMPLYDIQYEFQKSHSHIAIVYRSLNESSVRRRMRPETSTRASKEKQLMKDSCHMSHIYLVNLSFNGYTKLRN